MAHETVSTSATVMLPAVGSFASERYQWLRFWRPLAPHRNPPHAERPPFLPDSYGVTATVQQQEAGRAAERLLTLLGVPLLLTVVGAVSATLWNDRATNATRDAAVVSLAERLDSARIRQREDIDAVRGALTEAVRRGEQARGELTKQVTEQAVVLNQFRVQASVLNEQVTGMRSDLQEIKAILQNRPIPRAVDRLPPGGWSAPR